MFQELCVVVKFDDSNKDAVSIYSGTKEECLQRAAYYRGIYFNVPNTKFGTYPAWYYDECQRLDRTDKGNLYDLLKTSSY